MDLHKLAGCLKKYIGIAKIGVFSDFNKFLTWISKSVKIIEKSCLARLYLIAEFT